MKKFFFLAALLCANVMVYAEPTAAAPAPTWPADQVKAIYSSTYNADCGFGEWGSGTAYTQDTYGKKYVTGALGYFGLDGFNLNCLTMEKLHFDFWVDADASIRVVPIWKTGGANGPEQGVTISLTGGQWNSIDLTKEQYSQITDWSEVYQIKIDNAANLTLWMGNAFFYRETAVEDDEKPTDASASKVSESYFLVVLAVSAKDNSNSVEYTIKNGESTVAVGAGVSGDTVKITVVDLTPNTEYTFSMIAKDAKGNAADTVSVSAKTLALPTAAPTPDLTGKQVVPVFCDATENEGPHINIGQWGQTTAVKLVELAEGDQVGYGFNFNYLGWELSPSVDATGMEYLHVDYYSTTLTKISITPISQGHEGAYIHTLTAGEWNQVDIPLTAYDGKDIDWTSIFQFKFMDATPAGGDLFVDNVYFYKAATEGVEEVGTSDKTIKVLENGQVYILRNGVRYNAIGQEVR